MFKKILVANRGEIAIRIMRTCRELGIKSVAIYSSADENALHRYYADEAYYVGKADPKDSYLNIERIVEIAKKSGAEAIHPGYGFVSENPSFAKRCEEEGIVFIGPPPKVLEISGSKIEARRKMKSAKVPIVPGSPAISSLDRAFKWAEKIGYPVAVKASGGGGGIGITVAWNEGELESAFTKSRAFGEKYFKDPDEFVRRLSKIIRNEMLLEALKSLNNKKLKEADNVLRAMLNLYRFIVLGDLQGYYQFVKELSNCYRMLTEEKELRRREEYMRILSSLRGL